MQSSKYKYDNLIMRVYRLLGNVRYPAVLDTLLRCPSLLVELDIVFLQVPIIYRRRKVARDGCHRLYI